MKNVSGCLGSSPYDFRVRRPCHALHLIQKAPTAQRLFLIQRQANIRQCLVFQFRTKQRAVSGLPFLIIPINAQIHRVRCQQIF